MKALRITMCAVAMLLTVVTLLCAFAHFYVFNPARYEANILCEEFYAASLRQRDKALDELESVVAVEREVLLGFFNDESCKTLARQYVSGLLSEVLEGKTGAMNVRFAPEGFKEYLDSEFAKYDFSDTEYGSSSVAAEKAYEMTVSNMSTAVCFTPQTYVQKALKYIAGIRNAAVTVASLWYLFGIAAVGLFCGAIFMCKKRLANLFMPASFLWCGCMLMFIPAAMVRFGGVASTLELSKNQLYYFLTGALNAMKDGAFITTLVPAILATAALGAAVYFKVQPED